MIELTPLGDRAWLATLASAAEARAWGRAIEEAGLPGLVDVVVAYSKVAAYFDPDLADLGSIAERLARIKPQVEGTPRGRTFEIPTLYDGEDLNEAAARLGLERGRVASLHASVPYDVLAVGFMPGFPYAGDLPEALRGLPRRDSPRTRVPAGSVAITGRQTCIYPRESPGGWLLIGRTPVILSDFEAGFLPIRAGDRLRFLPIDRGQFEALAGERLLSGDESR